MTSRNYCFTINNPTDLPDLNQETVKYAIYSEEIGENGTNHLQGYIELKKPVRMAYVHKLSGMATASLQVRRGTPEQARAYCMKTDDPTYIDGPYEFGEFCGQGARSDWTALKKDIDDKKTIQEISDNHFKLFIMWNRGIKEYRLSKAIKRDWKTEVTFLYGPTGTGKSRYCKESSPDAYWKPRSEWWDGYNGIDDVIIDDFYGWLPYDFMLRAMDRYSLQVYPKGSAIEFAPKRLFISSNKLPHEWWTDKVPFNHAAFYRRVDKIIYMPSLEESIVYKGADMPNFHIKFDTLRKLL